MCTLAYTALTRLWQQLVPRQFSAAAGRAHLAQHSTRTTLQAHLVLVHERRQHGEGGAGLGHDGDGHGGADPVLALLHLEVVEQGDQHVLGPDGLGDVAKGVDGGPPDALFVGLEHVQQLEADAHPLAGRHELCAPVCNAAHQVYAVLLHLQHSRVVAGLPKVAWWAGMQELQVCVCSACCSLCQHPSTAVELVRPQA